MPGGDCAATGILSVGERGQAGGAWHDGLIVEVHPNPVEALCDGPQQLTPRRFARLMDEVKRVAEAVGRSL